MGFPRQEYWSGFPFPSPGVLSYPWINAGGPQGFSSQASFPLKFTSLVMSNSFMIFNTITVVSASSFSLQPDLFQNFRNTYIHTYIYTYICVYIYIYNCQLNIPIWIQIDISKWTGPKPTPGSPCLPKLLQQYFPYKCQYNTTSCLRQKLQCLSWLFFLYIWTVNKRIPWQSGG